MSAGQAQNNLINAVTNQLAQDDPAKALQWANQLPDGGAKNHSHVAGGEPVGQ